MGIVKISDQIHENVRIASNALSRSMNAQAEHWMKIGMLAELYPQLDYHAICRLLIRLDQQGGIDLVSMPEQITADWPVTISTVSSKTP